MEVIPKKQISTNSEKKAKIIYYVAVREGKRFLEAFKMNDEIYYVRRIKLERGKVTFTVGKYFIYKFKNFDVSKLEVYYEPKYCDETLKQWLLYQKNVVLTDNTNKQVKSEEPEKTNNSLFEDFENIQEPEMIDLPFTGQDNKIEPDEVETTENKSQTAKDSDLKKEKIKEIFTAGYMMACQKTCEAAFESWYKFNQNVY